jgi:hypothetical protein
LRCICGNSSIDFLYRIHLDHIYLFALDSEGKDCATCGSVISTDGLVGTSDTIVNTHKIHLNIVDFNSNVLSSARQQNSHRLELDNFIH